MNSRQKPAMKRQADHVHPITAFDLFVCVIAGMGIFVMFMQALAWAAGAR